MTTLDNNNNNDTPLNQKTETVLNEENHVFDVEINSLLDTVINRIYKSEEFAIRELISNASDACDKLKFEYNKLEEYDIAKPSELRINVFVKDSYITIQDNGIGMTKCDLVKNLGMIANSGTKEFKQKFDNNTFDKTSVGNLIGQFGLGFYSAFLLGKEVVVTTKHATDGCYKWTCNGTSAYKIEEVVSDDGMKHGTSVALKLKDEYKEYNNADKIEGLIKKFNGFIDYPIYIHKEVEEEIEVKEEKMDIEEEKKDEEEKMDIEEEKKDEDEPKVEEVTETKKEKVKVVKPVLINKTKPLWLKKPSECTHEEYSTFYKELTKDWEDYLAVKHVTLEGTINLTMLLFIPKRSRSTYFEKPKKDNIKLYVQNVFMTDDLKDCVPDWMNFVYGAICSDDVPMNVNRESFQGNNTMKMIKNNLSKKVFDMMEEISKNDEKYKTFLSEFGVNLKLAVKDLVGAQQERVAKLLRFYTSKSEDKEIGLDEYIERNKDNKAIYIITGLSKQDVAKSPYLSLYKDNEVVFMCESMDEFMLQSFSKYKDLELKKITSGTSAEIGKVDEDVEKSFEEFTKELKTLLDKYVEKVTLKDLGDVPCIVSTSAYGMTPAMENILRAQPGMEKNPMLSFAAMAKKNFEVNPKNEIIATLKKKFDEKDPVWKKYALFLYNTSAAECGFKIENVNSYAKDVYGLMTEILSGEKSKANVEEINGDEAL